MLWVESPIANERRAEVRARDQDLEYRLTWLAFAFDGAVVLLYKGLSQGQPQSLIRPRARHQWVEDAIADRLGIPGPLSSIYAKPMPACTQFAVDCDATRHPRLENQHRIAVLNAINQCLRGVMSNVEYGLNQLFAIPGTRAPRCRSLERP